MKRIDTTLRMLTVAREEWMLHHNDDFDADFYAGLFEDARICLERINDNCDTVEEAQP